MKTTSLITILRRIHRQQLGLTAIRVLALLETRGTSAMHVLAAHTGLSTAALTGTVDRLVAQGFATRDHALADRRKILVTLTPKGTQALSAITRPIPQPA